MILVIEAVLPDGSAALFPNWESAEREGAVCIGVALRPVSWVKRGEKE